MQFHSVTGINARAHCWPSSIDQFIKFISTAHWSSKFETEAASSKAQTQSLALAVDTKWSAWNSMPTMPEKG